LIEANKQLVKTEDELISDYIERYNWEMQTTGTGLRYMIYSRGEGPPVMPAKSVRMDYTIHLLTGELCYSSEKDGTKEFILGKAEIENGLEEGILLLHVGDKAKFIIPSHLAFGLMGDFNKIPQKAALVYDLQILGIKN